MSVNALLDLGGQMALAACGARVVLAGVNLAARWRRSKSGLRGNRAIGTGPGGGRRHADL
jgi:hypothetical protein